MVKSCLQIFNPPLVGWWLGFGCGWAKLNVLQKLWLVFRLAALLILRRIGILSVVLLFVCCRLCRLLGLQLTFCKQAKFAANVQPSILAALRRKFCLLAVSGSAFILVLVSLILKRRPGILLCNSRASLVLHLFLLGH
jgi:hypothetical protein